MNNKSFVTEITNNNADGLIGICEEGRIYTLTFTVEGQCYLEIRLLDNNTSEIKQIINPHTDFISKKYGFRFLAHANGNLKFFIRGNAKIKNIVLLED